MPGFEGIDDGFGDEAADASFAVELHLTFGGVDVDVDLAGIEFQKKAAERVATLHEGVVVAFDQGGIETAVFNRPPVDEEMLVVPGGPGDARGTDPSPNAGFGGRRDFCGSREIIGSDADGVQAAAVVDGYEGQSIADEQAQTFAEGMELSAWRFGGGEGWELPDGFAFEGEMESDLGMR